MREFILASVKNTPLKKRKMKSNKLKVILMLFMPLTLFGIYKTIINPSKSFAALIIKPNRKEISIQEANLEVLVDVNKFRMHKQYLSPKFSPAGKIAFLGIRSNPDGSDYLDILVTNSEGKFLNLIPDTRAYTITLSWKDEHIVFTRRNGGKQTHYKVPALGGEWSKIEPQYPKDIGIRMDLSYLNEIEVASGYKEVEDDKFILKLYIDGKLNKIAEDWDRYFCFSPDGTTVAYTKTKRIPYNKDKAGSYTIRRDLYIQAIKPLDKVNPIRPISEPIIVEQNVT